MFFRVQKPNASIWMSPEVHALEIKYPMQQRSKRTPSKRWFCPAVVAYTFNHSAWWCIPLITARGGRVRWIWVWSQPDLEENSRTARAAPKTSKTNKRELFYHRDSLSWTDWCWGDQTSYLRIRCIMEAVWHSLALLHCTLVLSAEEGMIWRSFPYRQKPWCWTFQPPIQMHFFSFGFPCSPV